LGSRAVLDAAVKRKIPSLRRESNPRTPIVQPVAQITRQGDTRMIDNALHEVLLKSVERLEP
jgi:hypothetical protein